MRHLVIGFFLLSAHVCFAADFTYTQVTETKTVVTLPKGMPDSLKSQMGAMLKPTRTEETHYFSNKKYAVRSKDSLQIFDFEAEKVIEADLKSKTYTQQSMKDHFATISKQLESAQKQMSGKAEVEVEVEEKVSATGATKTILGLSCKILKEEFTMGGQGMTMLMKSDYCYATNPPKAMVEYGENSIQAAAKYLGPLAKKYSPTFANGQLQSGNLTFKSNNVEGAHNRVFKLEGKSVTKPSKSQPGMPGTTVVMTYKVSNLSEKKIDPSVFQTPAGFKRVAPMSQ